MDAGKALFCSFELASMNSYEVDEDLRAIRCSNLNEPKDVTETKHLFLNIYRRLMVVWTQKHTHRPILVRTFGSVPVKPQPEPNYS